MDDRQIEQLLRGYTAVGPPPDLRGRILTPVPVIRVWPWAAAASVMLAGTIALHVLADRTVAGADIGAGPDQAQLAIEQLTEMLGGDDAARRIAEVTILRTQMQIESAPASLPDIDDEAR